MRDHNSLTKSMGAIYIAFLTDIADHHGFVLDREIERVKNILSSSGTQGLLSFLGKHEAALIGYFRTGVICLDSIRHDNEGYPLFLNSLWRDDSVACKADLHQAFAMLKKWAEEEPRGCSTEEDFVSRMHEQSSFNPRVVDLIADELPHLIGAEDLKLSDLFPFISSGARRDRVPVLQRIDTLLDIGYDRDLYTAIKRVDDRAQNRAVVVPKSWDKQRLVFAESSARMNAQQAVRLWLEERVSYSREKRISFDDQTVQQESLRLSGRSSIDLSDASDHLDRLVIWRFFRKYPILRSTLFRSRSQSTVIANHSVPLRCYGTMGNATTFTVMSIFLSCLTRLAEKSTFETYRVNPRYSTVFGDDIVADDLVCDSVLPLLRAVGLKPNPRKTFVRSAFRESCGLDLFRNEDITPVRVRHTRVRCASDVIMMCDLSNRLHKRGYWKTAHVIASLSGKSLTVNVDEASLISFSLGADTTNARWNHDLQRHESRYVPRVHSKVRQRDSLADLQYTLRYGIRITELSLCRGRKR